MIVELLVSLVAQPLLWCLILAGYLVSRRRIQQERQTFHIAIDSRLNEFRAFLFTACRWGSFCRWGQFY